ncbi:MAG: hypothetical protein IJ783_10765, partial [Kiritimatiellae bacterium]|nr:hypothetical protein [Kiritimatiellia bacterium]
MKLTSHRIMVRQNPVSGRHDVLLATVGTSPAVLAETVWALAHPSREGAERIVPDEVIALTTLMGKERIERDLL